MHLMYVLVHFGFSYFTMIDFGQSFLLHGSSAHIYYFSATLQNCPTYSTFSNEFLKISSI